ncbi:unnamed protein product [Caenorhabditis bovis]|uniref:DUF19 domain-containing protein n=1 Tax=Caenorhabditis bovis TaxID=2654633 RepID=A0A8S1ERF8_9PELO|nr:unnamed protein product [Caenorhabditis bovis]
MRSLWFVLFLTAASVDAFKTNRTSCFQYVECLESIQSSLKDCVGGTAISLTLEAKDVNIRDLVKYRALEFVGCQDRLLKEIVDFEALQILVNEDARECFDKLPESSKRIEPFTDSCDYVQPAIRNNSRGDSLQCLIDFKQDREYCESLLECCPDHTRCGERMNAVSLSYQNSRVKAEQIVYNMISCIVSNDPRFLREGARLQALRDPYRNAGIPFLRPDAYTESRISRRLALTSTATLAQRRERFLKKYSQIRQVVAQKLVNQFTTTTSTTEAPETEPTPEVVMEVKKIEDEVEEKTVNDEKEDQEAEDRVQIVRDLIRTASDKDLSTYVSLISEGKFSELFRLADKKHKVEDKLDSKVKAKLNKLKDILTRALEKSSEVDLLPEDIKSIATRSSEDSKKSEVKKTDKKHLDVDEVSKDVFEEKKDDEKKDGERKAEETKEEAKQTEEKKEEEKKEEKKSEEKKEEEKKEENVKEENEKKEDNKKNEEKKEEEAETKVDEINEKESVPSVFTISDTVDSKAESRLSHTAIDRKHRMVAEVEKVEKKLEVDEPEVKELTSKDRALLVEKEIKESAQKEKDSDDQMIESLVQDDLPKLEQESGEKKEKEKDVIAEMMESIKSSTTVAPEVTSTLKSELISNLDEVVLTEQQHQQLHSSKVSEDVEGSGEEHAPVTTTEPSEVIANVRKIHPRLEQTHCQEYASCWQTLLDYEEQCDRKYSTEVLSHGIDDAEILSILQNSSISHHEIVLKACLRPLDRTVHSTLKQLLVIQRGVRKACLELGRNKIAVTDAEEKQCSVEIPTTASADEFFSSVHARSQANHLTCRAKLEPIREACNIVRDCCASVDTCDNYIASSPVKKLETEAVRRLVKKQNDCETKMLQTLSYIHEQLSSPSRRRRFYYH